MGFINELETKDINDFAQEALTLYKFYESKGDKLTQEYIAVRLNQIYNHKKQRPNLVGWLDEREEINSMADHSRRLVSERIGKPALNQILMSFVIVIVAYQTLTRLLNLDTAVTTVITMIVLVLVNYIFARFKSDRIILKTNQLYKDKVDSQILKYFHFYLD